MILCAEIMAVKLTQTNNNPILSEDVRERLDSLPKDYDGLVKILQDEKGFIESFEKTEGNQRYQVEIDVRYDDRSAGKLRVSATIYPENKRWWQKFIAISSTVIGFTITKDGMVENF